MKINLATCVQKLSDASAKVGIAVKKHAPEILTTLGVVGFGATIYSACKATTKLEDIKEEAKASLDEIDEEEAKGNPEYDSDMANKDRRTVKLRTAAKVAKAFATTAALMIFTLSCFLGAHDIMRKRNVALSAVAIASDNAFKEYREAVAKKFGEEAEHDLRYGLIEKNYEVETVDEKGKTKTEVVTEKAVDKSWYNGQFDFYFDKDVIGWEKNSNCNKTYVLARETWANAELKRRYYTQHEPLTVNDVRDMFNLPRLTEGWSAGWWYDPKRANEKQIDFKIFNVHDPDSVAFVNGHSRSVRVCLEPQTLDVWRYV